MQRQTVDKPLVNSDREGEAPSELRLGECTGFHFVNAIEPRVHTMKRVNVRNPLVNSDREGETPSLYREAVLQRSPGFAKRTLG